MSGGGRRQRHSQLQQQQSVHVKPTKQRHKAEGLAEFGHQAGVERCFSGTIGQQ